MATKFCQKFLYCDSTLGVTQRQPAFKLITWHAKSQTTKSFPRLYTWNIRRLVNGSFVPSAQRTSVVYCRLSDLYWMSWNCISNFGHCAKQGNESKYRHMKWREMTSLSSWIVNNFGWQSSFVQDFNRTPTHFFALSIDSTY